MKTEVLCSKVPEGWAPDGLGLGQSTLTQAGFCFHFLTFLLYHFFFVVVRLFFSSNVLFLLPPQPFPDSISPNTVTELGSLSNPQTHTPSRPLGSLT